MSRIFSRKCRIQDASDQVATFHRRMLAIADEQSGKRGVIRDWIAHDAIVHRLKRQPGKSDTNGPFEGREGWRLVRATTLLGVVVVVSMKTHK